MLYRVFLYVTNIYSVRHLQKTASFDRSLPLFLSIRSFKGCELMTAQPEIKKQNIDFSSCRCLGEIYEVLRQALELPEWFGANLDALWDAVTGMMYTPVEIRILPEVERSELKPEVDEIIELLREAEEKYHEISVVVVDSSDT